MELFYNWNALMLKISQIQTFTQNQTFFRPLLTYKTEFRLAENSNQTGRPASYNDCFRHKPSCYFIHINYGCFISNIWHIKRVLCFDEVPKLILICCFKIDQMWSLLPIFGACWATSGLGSGSNNIGTFISRLTC